jgi:hypothetical protein
MNTDCNTSLKALTELVIGNHFELEQSLTSSVTTSWGVNWDVEYIARDLMQNFFDANRSQLDKIQILVDGTTVRITAPTPFELLRLFYLGSEKGADDVGQYGEGFKAAAVCLLRDHQVYPIVLSGNQAVCLRIASRVEGTELQPVAYDFFRLGKPFAGTQMILRGCSSRLVKAVQNGLTHFFHPGNTLLGKPLWAKHDATFAIYASTTPNGHVFYRNFKRGEIPDIPIVLVIAKTLKRIEGKIRSDRDRNAFGGEMMKMFYNLFARHGTRDYDQAQQVIVMAAQEIWTAGHPLISEVAAAADYRYPWKADAIRRVFGDSYYAVCKGRNLADTLEIESYESAWRADGKRPLPNCFRRFGVLNADGYRADLMRRALEEQRRRYHRNLLDSEQAALRILLEAIKELAPNLMNHFHPGRTTYSVADTEIVLGELKKARGYRDREVFLSTAVFVSDFASAFSTFLHEHGHIFGHDGSRGFTDCLTELLEIVIRERGQLDRYETRWKVVSIEIQRERAEKVPSSPECGYMAKLAGMSESQLRDLLAKLPETVIRRGLEAGSR